jgi:hypothetical protein
MIEVLSFLNESAIDIRNFKASIEQHQQNCMIKYALRNDPMDLTRYTEGMRPYQRESWDTMLRNIDPEVYDKYLSRYAS